MPQAAIEDADEAVGEGTKRLRMALLVGAPCVIEAPGTR
jgi:hypothetical protein